jgi:Uma2 family endonuclease
MATAAPHTPPPAPFRKEPFPRPWTPAEFQKMQQMSLFAGRAVSLVGGQILEHAPGDPAPRPVVFTRKEYYALDEGLFFLNQRVQLIGGVIVQESPMNPPHAVAVSLAQQVLTSLFGTGFHTRVQLPIDLGMISEPHPDLAVVTGSPRDYLTDHPHTALLVVEVAETTLEADTHEKANLYAAGGIADYWVIDLAGGRLLVFRDPKPFASEAFGHAYARVTALGPGDSVAPLAAPNSPVRVADLLP